jgi:hypothetical protein
MKKRLGRARLVVPVSGLFLVAMLCWLTGAGVAEEPKDRVTLSYAKGSQSIEQLTKKALGLKELKEEAKPVTPAVDLTLLRNKQAGGPKANRFLSEGNPLSGTTTSLRSKSQKGSLLMPLGGDRAEEAYVGMAEIDRKDMTRFSVTSPIEYRAELLLGVRMNENNSILFGRSMHVDRPADVPSKVQDDGWRIRFMKRF